MEIPDKLLQQYHLSRPKPAKIVKEKPAPLYRTFKVMLFFEDGEIIDDVEVSMPNRPYWGGQLENDIRNTLNKRQQPGCKIRRVKVFRNSREGGFMVDALRGGVVNVW